MTFYITCTNKKYKSRFDCRIEPHHHFFCRKCGYICDLDIKGCTLAGKKMMDGHKIEELRQYVIGICSKCLKRERFPMIDGVLQLMLTAIVVGSIGIYLFKDLGVIMLSLKATSIGAQVVGGLIFGVGWALLGYCPGISAGALGEGHVDAFWGCCLAAPEEMYQCQTVNCGYI